MRKSRYKQAARDMSIAERLGGAKQHEILEGKPVSVTRPPGRTQKTRPRVRPNLWGRECDQAGNVCGAVGFHWSASIGLRSWVSVDPRLMTNDP